MKLSVSNIFRHKKKSMIAILLILLLITLTNIYLKNIESNIRQLNHLKDAVPVFCQITDLKGTKESGLAIPSDMLKNLEESQNIEKLTYTVRMMGGIGNFREEEWSKYLNLNIMSSNSLKELIGSGIGNMNLSLEEQEAFIDTSKPQCLVNKGVMEDRGWKIGDVIELNLYYYFYDDKEGINLFPLNCMPVKIMGEIPEDAGTAHGMPLDLILPVRFVQEEYQKANIDFMADSASFYVKNPLKLNEFKKEMQSYHFLPQSANAFPSYCGNALTVRDDTFISLATNLQQTISLLKTCFVPICIGVMGIGYLVSFLLMRGRQKEYLLMRMMGMKAGQCMRIYLLEQILLSLTGAGVGAVCFIFSTDRKVIVCTAFVVLCFYLVGVCAALWIFLRKNMMELLHMKE